MCAAGMRSDVTVGYRLMLVVRRRRTIAPVCRACVAGRMGPLLMPARCGRCLQLHRLGQPPRPAACPPCGQTMGRHAAAAALAAAKAAALTTSMTMAIGTQTMAAAGDEASTRLAVAACAG